VVESVDGDTLYLKGVTLVSESNVQTGEVTGFDKSVSVEDRDLEIDFIHDPNDSDQIVRNDGGDWARDGFSKGQKITITGSAENNNTYEIESVVGNIIYLVKTDLSNEYSVVGAAIKSDAGNISVTANTKSVIVATSLSGSPPLVEMKASDPAPSGSTQNSGQKKSFGNRMFQGQKPGMKEPGKIALNGTFSLVDVDNTTAAHVDGGFIINSGNLFDVKANDSTFLVNASTAFAYAGDIGGAGNVAINKVDRDTTALIGDAVNDPAGEVIVTGASKLTVDATNGGGLVSVAVSGVLQQSLNKNRFKRMKPGWAERRAVN